uniref:Apple domain-containing protein n=1 Tax=Steinernema glaseri TaxID=37863 RepID=A0A1I7ZQ77_9BILA
MFSSGRVLGLLLFVSLPLAVFSSDRPNHFGNPCSLCKCFVEYTDRDLALPGKPYKVAAEGYDTTEDRCLALCLQEQECKAVVYGLVGGRSVFTCELYDSVNSRANPTYVPFMNVYLPRNAECTVPTSEFAPLQTVEQTDSVLKRKEKYRILQTRPNLFNFGK